MSTAVASRPTIAPDARFAAGAAFIEGDYVPISEAKISVLDWGFIRSDVTYDVVHVWKGRFFRLAHHLDRFERSVEGMRLKLPLSRLEMERVLHELMRLSGLRDAYVEVICTRGLAPAGCRDPRQFQNRFIAFAIPFVWIANEEMRRRGVNLHLSSVLRIPPQSVDPRFKNFHWADMIRALHDALDHGCDMPVLVDLDGNIAEGPGFNVFAVKDGVVTTPGGTCLEGITRQTALDLLADLNVKSVIGAVSPDALRTADEVFITSTAGGILPVTKIDGRPVSDGEIGPLSGRIAALYWQRHDEGWDATPIAYKD
jgi:branched-subunit amino acid aminotransferase/4-amino-4-deoxychorismate lyase